MKQRNKNPLPDTSPNEKEDEKEFLEDLPFESEPTGQPGDEESEKPSARIGRSRADQAVTVDVLQDVIGLITTPEIAPEAGERAAKQRELNEVIHSMLVLGLGLSTAVMCMGIILSLFFRIPLPSTIPSIRQIVWGLDRLSPSSFLSLGILLLIATPILRVFGSIIEFVIIRDWRYAALTFLVLIILSIGILVGRG